MSFLTQMSYSLLLQPTQTSRVGETAEPLPDCDFIQSNQHAARHGPQTTATKEGRAQIKKKPRKNPAPEKKRKPAAPAKKQPAAAGRRKNPAPAKKD